MKKPEFTQIANCASVVGLILTALSLLWVTLNNDFQNYLRIALFIFNLVFLISTTFYLSISYLKNKKERNLLNKTKDKLDKYYEDFSNFSFGLQYQLQRTLNEFENIKLNNNQELKERNTKDLKRICKDFYQKIIKYTHDAIKSYLETIDYLTPCTITVKRKINEVEGERVVSIFRDWETFRKGKRGIGIIRFNLDKNSALSYLDEHCKKSITYFNLIYENNFIDKDNKDYINENPNYFNEYNAIIMVPIAIFDADYKVVYGFLGCDTLKPSDKIKQEVFDKNVGMILLSAAACMAIFIKYYDEVDSLISN
ncbi:MAG: hypothetical protein ACYDEJ_02310 [Desulfitobacteriaceae bacterium]